MHECIGRLCDRVAGGRFAVNASTGVITLAGAVEKAGESAMLLGFPERRMLVVN